MMLSSYLSTSRHGVFYFRWPLPHAYTGSRRTLRLSLQTKCPYEAGDFARYLALCGKSLKENRALATLRHDEIRSFVKEYFKRSLEKYRNSLGQNGAHDRAQVALSDELQFHIEGLDGFDDISDQYLDDRVVPEFRAFAKISDATWSAEEPRLRTELRRGRRDVLVAMLRDIKQLDHYTFAEGTGNASTSVPVAYSVASARLDDVVNDFFSEMSLQWAPKTVKQNSAYLSVMLEFFGTDKVLAEIDKKDASELKKLLQMLPASRNTKPALKELPLLEVVKVEGHQKISPKTINSHIQMYASFFDWAQRHGYAEEKLFAGMKVAKAKKSPNQRKPFSSDQTQKMYVELTQNGSGLVRKESHKWGMLLGMYTGARLNEICQLHIADVQQQDGIWFLNITDDGDETKSIKSEAGKRKVPLHSKLIEDGFLEFVESRKSSERLFPDYSFNVNGGYGRNLGRWCNESFLPKLGIKTPSLVFHSFRHTMVTRLGQANVAEPIYQCIVGHARSGVTQEVYLKEGFTLGQLKDAIDRYTV
ncbi:MAG: site-specific integrase [Pseudomonadota bacterium]